MNLPGSEILHGQLTRLKRETGRGGARRMMARLANEKSFTAFGEDVIGDILDRQINDEIGAIPEIIKLGLLGLLRDRYSSHLRVIDFSLLESKAIFHEKGSVTLSKSKV